jgi:hypothetical protein
MDAFSGLVSTFTPPLQGQAADGDETQLCFGCGRSQSVQLSYCGTCRKPLPSLLRSLTEKPAERSELVLVPDFYQPFYEACNAVASGAITPEQWAEEWEKVARQLDAAWDSVADALGALDAEDEDAAGPAEEMEAGLDGAREALESMEAYLDEPDPEILNQGWLALIRATGRIQRAAAEFALLQARAADAPEAELA